MLTIMIRWKVIFEPVCWFLDHEWEEYLVIHAAWNAPGKYCKRCRMSVTRRWSWGLTKGEVVTIAKTPKEEVQPWFSIKAS